MQASQGWVKLLTLGLFVTFISPAVGAQTTNDIPTADIQRFTTAIQDIKQYYVEPVDDQTLFDNAIRGMLAGLDPHSSYLDISDYADLQSSTQGEFAGVGLEVDMDNDFVRVVSPIDDTPAAKAGLKPGDFIVKINNQPLDGLSLVDAVKLMRGPKGTPVELTVLRKGMQQPLQFKLLRDTIRVQSVKSQLLAPGYAYVRISQFQAPTANDLVNAIKRLQQNNKTPLKGFILDLRNNPGGLLDSAVAISNDFLNSAQLGKNKLIVYTKGRAPNSSFQANATGDDLIHGIPMIVLINGGSASAAEIVAGALQDHKRAIIMGKTSFGKGSVQTVLPLDKEQGIKITTALYYTPNGRSIQAKGITPDIEVDELAIQNPKTNNVLEIKEADLAKHLSNGNADNSQNTIMPDKPLPSTTPDPSLDYQLNQALVLLQGLNALHGTAYKPSE